MSRRGDDPGYFLSAEFWADRYRDAVTGALTTSQAWRERIARKALEDATPKDGHP
jgi:hypothetical protein